MSGIVARVPEQQEVDSLGLQGKPALHQKPGALELLKYLRNAGCEWDYTTCDGAAEGGQPCLARQASVAPETWRFGSITCVCRPGYGQLIMNAKWIQMCSVQPPNMDTFMYSSGWKIIITMIIIAMNTITKIRISVRQRQNTDSWKC